LIFVSKQFTQLSGKSHIKSKGVPRQAEVALGVLGRLRPRIIFTFSTTRVVGHQAYTPAAFTRGEIPGIHFQGLSQPQGTWFCQWEPRRKSPVTPPGIDPGAVRLAAQCLNHYATPGPESHITTVIIMSSSGVLKGTGIPVISRRGLQSGDHLIPNSVTGIMLVHADCKKDE